MEFVSLSRFILKNFSRIGISATLLLSSCASKVPPKNVFPSKESSQGAENFLVGSIPTLQNKTLDLRDVGEGSYVIIFAAESCLSCRQETEHLIKLFGKKSAGPNNVKIVSILLGASFEDAEYWSNSFSEPIPWTVGYDSDLSIYRQYFDVLQTPSILAGSKVLSTFRKFTGRQEQQILEKETGKWDLNQM